MTVLMYEENIPHPYLKECVEFLLLKLIKIRT
jgi:hypothetical protein